ncbi:type II toxin-antitoxin system RelE/ParE family toxin [Candidatus Uhrbacteria bacterium]|nr:type II toxin-antitoxin system RelE/ParE family toxin [Candidatus Uhrbacteria bacterium]
MELWYIHPSIKKYIDALEEPTRAQVARLLLLLMEKGPSLGMPLSKHIGHKLYELRHLGGLNIRIFYTFHKERIAVLDVIKKKSQKLQKKDLAKARSRLQLLHER